MTYKYNEKEYGKLIYEKGFQTRFIRYELIVLVKYLKYVEDFSKKKTEEFLYEFCKKYIEGFNKVKYYKVIDGAIRNGRKRSSKLIVIDKINIMKNEIEYIDKLDIDNEHKKLLLSILVSKKISMEIYKINHGEAKLSTYFNGTRKKFSEVFKNAKIIGKHKINDMIKHLVDKGILESIIKGDLGLKFIEEIMDIKVEDDVFYELKTKEFECVGHVFDFYKGDSKIKKCEECGCLIRLRTANSNTKYCDECAREIHKEIKRNTWHKNKNKYKH